MGMSRADLTQAVADALNAHRHPRISAVEVLDPDGEYGNEGVLSIVFEGDEAATFVTIVVEG